MCLPPYREGLPKSLIEAAACGRPIVTTDVPGCNDVVNNSVNGYLVNVGDAETLAVALQPYLAARLARSNGKSWLAKINALLARCCLKKRLRCMRT